MALCKDVCRPLPTLAFLRMMQLFAQKADFSPICLPSSSDCSFCFLAAALKPVGAAIRSRIVIGLSTASISQLAVRVIWQRLRSTAPSIARPSIKG